MRSSADPLSNQMIDAKGVRSQASDFHVKDQYSGAQWCRFCLGPFLYNQRIPYCRQSTMERKSQNISAEFPVPTQPFDAYILICQESTSET
jgi:hypothetical protein